VTRRLSAPKWRTGSWRIRIGAGARSTCANSASGDLRDPSETGRAGDEKQSSRFTDLDVGLLIDMKDKTPKGVHRECSRSVSNSFSFAFFTISFGLFTDPSSHRWT
jgi:hypothetical protein